MMYCRNCGKELIGTPEYCMNCGARPMNGSKFCHACGVATDQLAEICVKCGARLINRSPHATGVSSSNVSSKSRLVVTLLAFFLGQLGVHRFYTGHVTTGVVQLLLTIIGCFTVMFIFGMFLLIAVGIWVLVDFIMAIAGKFKDKEGKLILNWES
jgi:TM2 domain-containing membrane protein YozV